LDFDAERTLEGLESKLKELMGDDFKEATEETDL